MPSTMSCPRNANPVGGAAAADPAQPSLEQYGAYATFAALRPASDASRMPPCVGVLVAAPPDDDVSALLRAAHDDAS